MSIQLKRIYDSVSDDDGRRVLVDGMWPRGVKKADAAAGADDSQVAWDNFDMSTYLT